jgi:hypothetical protein
MKRLTKVIILLLILSIPPSCAMWQLPKGATSEEWKAATCTDARTGYELSVAMLDGSVKGQSRVYWEGYKIGANIFLTRYCP